MQTTQHTNEHTANFTARIINGLRSLFVGSETGGETLAANCANDILRVAGLAEWIESIAALKHRERMEMLLRASGIFSSELVATDLSNILSCMAADAGLFLAVTQALKETGQHTSYFKQAA